MSVGSFALVLHSHLPWLAHHGTWPVGEEWLHQAWSQSYLPLVRVLRGLADEGQRDVLTLGVTPILAAQLDDPWCLRETATWHGLWRLRAEELAARAEPALREHAAAEFRAACAGLDDLATTWRHGASPVLRGLADAGVVELLGGPTAHPVLPLLHPDVARLALRTGLDDSRWRYGSAPEGIWLPECAHSPALADTLETAGVRRVVLDEAAFAAQGAPTSAGRVVEGTGVVAFARDLAVTDLVWSSRTGYPAGAAYRDFHAYDTASGTRPYAVTGPGVPSHAKAPYDAAAARAAVERDATAFVTAVRARLTDLAAARDGRPGLVVAAYDTELFGHWWHEGPQFLARVLRLLPEAGVRVTTLRGAVEAGHVEGTVSPGVTSWGAGKDLRVWDNDGVADLRDEAWWVQRRLLDVLGRQLPSRTRRPDLDQLVREALLALQSDWAFMVTRDQAPDYARRRAAGHRAAFHQLAEAVGRRGPGDPGHAGRPDALALAARQRRSDGPFGWLDARAVL